jgi:hypothetical protein
VPRETEGDVEAGACGRWGPATPRRTLGRRWCAALVDGVLEHDGVGPGKVHARHLTRLLSELGYASAGYGGQSLTMIHGGGAEDSDPCRDISQWHPILRCLCILLQHFGQEACVFLVRTRRPPNLHFSAIN